MKTLRSLTVAAATILCALGAAGAAGAQPNTPLGYHGGPVLKTFTIYPLYYGSWSAADVTAHQSYLTGLAAYLSGQDAPANTYQMLYQYGVTKATVGSSKTVGMNTADCSTLKSTPPMLSRSCIVNIIKKYLPGYYSSTALIIVFPATGITLAECTGCGFHGSQSASSFWAVVPRDAGVAAPYAVWSSSSAGVGSVPPDPGPFQLVTAHEVFEAAADPAIKDDGTPTGWDEAVDNCGTFIQLSFGWIPGVVDNTQGGTCSATGYTGAGRAYVWADQPTSLSYTPNLSFQFNSSAVSTTIVNTIARTDVGAYTVMLPKLSAKAGTVHVTAYGEGSAFCKVAGWNPSGSAQQVDVRCFSGGSSRFPLSAGTPVDSQFTVTSTYVGSSARPMAFLWADQPTAASYTPNPPYQFNSSGKLNTMVRTGVGAYTALLPNLGASGGHVQVTANGTGSERCKVAGWYPTGSAQQVNVRCFTSAGSAVDTRFTMTYVSGLDLLGSPCCSGTDSAYVWANQPTSSFYTPSLAYQFNNNTGATNTVTRSGVGAYAVQLPYESLSYGDVQVTAYGSGSEHCKVASWSPSGGVQVRCFNSMGSPVDTSFDMAFLRSYLR
jgi:hypothetical protein